MSPEIVGVIGIAVLMIFLFAGMWIGFAIGLVGFLGFAYLGGIGPALKVLATVPYRSVADYTLSVLPLFVLMGTVTANTGMSEDLYRTARTWVGQLRGGLCMATSIACAAFAAICGTTSAGCVTIGKVAVPEMKRHNYSESLGSACVCAGSTLGILIPPSLGFIVYGILTEQPIGKLYMAGILPGILLTTLFIVTVAIISRKNPHAAPPGPKTSFRQKIASLRSTWSMLTLFMLIMGGIYGGIFTATEAGAIGAFGALVISALGRRLTRQNLLTSLREAVQITGMILAIIIGAFIFMRFMAITKLPFGLAEIVSSLHFPRYGILASIVFLYIILGMFLEIWSSMVLTIPILFPTITTMGFDPIWFGVIAVILIEMGVITPPVGLNVFILSGVTGTPIDVIFRGVWVFVAAMLVCVIILTIFPQIALFIPNMM